MNPLNKQFRIPGDQIQCLIQNMGGCFAKDHITVDGLKGGCMFRELPNKEVLSGSDQFKEEPFNQ